MASMCDAESSAPASNARRSPMGKSSRSIKLAFIGSALLLPGCQDREAEILPEVVADSEDGFGAAPDPGGSFGPEGEAVAGGEGTANNGQGNANGAGYHRSGGAGVAGAIIGSQVARSMMRGGGGGGAPPAPPLAPSARGGFGASGGLGASA